jgi:photosystem II stability/assembly factor-like uncharacterized protein
MKTTFFCLCCFTLASFFASDVHGQVWEQTSGPGGDWIQSIAVNDQGHIFVVSRGLHRSTNKGQTWTQVFSQAPNFSLKKIFAQPSGTLILLLTHYSQPHTIDTAISGVYSSKDNGDTWLRISRSSELWQGAGGDLFVINNNQLVRSTDDGTSWVNINFTGIGSYYYDVTSDAAGKLFVCKDYLYRSTDNGYSWSKVVNGVPTRAGAFYAVKAGPDGLTFAFSGSGGQNDFVYRSIDGGRTWKVDSTFTNKVAILINTKNEILATGYPLRFSLDTGKTWTPFNFSFSANPASAAEVEGTFLLSTNRALYRFDPASGELKLLALPNGNIPACLAHSGGGLIAVSQVGYPGSYGESELTIWHSYTQGVTWQVAMTLKDDDYNDYVTMLALVEDSSGNILGPAAGSIVRSIDSGKNWSIVKKDLVSAGTIRSLAVRFTGDIFAASTNEGVFRSTDNGDTWDQLNAGITDQHLYSIAVHQNGDVYAGGKNTIYRSKTNGITWEKMTTDFPSGGNVTAIVVSTQGNVIAGIENAGVFWSTDNGETWTKRAEGFTATKVNALLSTPVGKVFAGTDEGIFYLDTVSNADWTQYSSGLTAKNVQTLCRDAAGRIYAGTDVSGIFRSIETFNIIAPSEVRQQDTYRTLTSLGAAYPNPTYSSATIPFSLVDKTYIRMEVVDMMGRTIAILANGIYNVGGYAATFDGSACDAGTYFVRLQTGATSIAKTIVIEK